MPQLSVDWDGSGQWPMCWPMHQIPRGAIIALFMVVMGGLAHARTAAEVQALVERAVAHVRDVGREPAFADCSRSDRASVDGEHYLFCRDGSGVVVAHGGNPKLIGRTMQDVRGPNRRPLGVEVISVGFTQRLGWLEYRWPKPPSKRIEWKSVYVLKVDDLTVCGSGYCKETPP